ncbi:MAG: hypothetical protein AB1452_05420 [Pseudomonadota bacterium]
MLTLIVVYASAAIRLGQAAAPPLGADALAVLRVVHRAAASLEVVVALLLAWLAWRARDEKPQLARAVGLVLVLTIFLSVLGVAAGRTPPPAAALGNVLGGLALVAAFAWILGGLRARAPLPGNRASLPAAVLLAAQCALGASLATLPGAWVWAAIPAHGILGIVLAAMMLLLLRRAAGVALACAVPLAGFSVLHLDDSAFAAFAHAAAAALLLVVAAHARLRAA